MASADQPERSAPSAGFWNGCLSGFSVAAGLVLLWFAYDFARLRDLYRDFQGPVPAISKLVTHPAYLNAVPVLVLLLVITGNLGIHRPRPLRIFLVVTACLAVTTVILGYWGATLPFSELAGNLSAD